MKFNLSELVLVLVQKCYRGSNLNITSVVWEARQVVLPNACFFSLLFRFIIIFNHTSKWMSTEIVWYWWFLSAWEYLSIHTHTHTRTYHNVNLLWFHIIAFGDKKVWPVHRHMHQGSGHDWSKDFCTEPTQGISLC